MSNETVWCLRSDCPISVDACTKRQLRAKKINRRLHVPYDIRCEDCPQGELVAPDIDDSEKGTGKKRLCPGCGEMRYASNFYWDSYQSKHKNVCKFCIAKGRTAGKTKRWDNPFDAEL